MQTTPVVLDPSLRTKCEIFSRVVGYHRPVGAWNKGKQEEFKDRLEFLEMASVKNPKFTGKHFGRDEFKPEAPCECK